jgi:hypothetical protein
MTWSNCWGISNCGASWRFTTNKLKATDKEDVSYSEFATRLVRTRWQPGRKALWGMSSSKK